MISIKTKYIGWTNTRPARVKADDGRGNSVVLSWDNDLGTKEMHLKTAEALCKKMEWPGMIDGGCYKNDYYWVFV